MLIWVRRLAGHPRLRFIVAALLLAAIGVSHSSQAAGKGEPGPVSATRVELRDRTDDLWLFREMGLDVDGVFDGWARVYLTPAEAQKLERLGYELTVLPPEPHLGEVGEAVPGVREVGTIPAQYHTYETLTSELQALASANPGLMRVSSIGQSVQGRELWMVKITDNPDVEEDEPGLVYFAAMHGDEVVGKEICIGLINYLLDNYGSDSRITDLVDESEIWILPSLNPDGTYLVQRYNANGYDLNRNFPDWFSDPNNTPDGRQIETARVMGWLEQNTITLGANFHGGALLANYPFDNNPTGSSVFSPTPDPDQPAYYSISLTYAENNPPMYASPSFPFGVTNGAEWYAIDGGMQDWTYTWYGNFHVTLEISNIKWPSATTLPSFWNDNLESMLSYLERAHEGVRGIVTDAVTGSPLAAEVRLDDNPFAVYTDPEIGDYHRIVLPGTYTMHVTTPGYYEQSIPVTVVAGPAVRYDVQLQPRPADLKPQGSRIVDGGNGVLDPDETTDLAVTLTNLGSLASSVTGRLVPTGWFGEVTRAAADYPDLGIQQSGESYAPHHQIHVLPDVPAGHRLGFAVEWNAVQGQGVSEPFFLDVGEPACESFAATDVPQAIVDYQTTSSQLQSTHAALIDEVRVTMNVLHTYIGDLRITLFSPEGTPVVLHDRSGGGGNDIVGTYGVDLTPAEPLSTLAGEGAAGTWALKVEDLGGGDTGTLVAWSVETCGYTVEAATPEMRLRDVVREPDGVLLEFWPYPGVTSYKVYRATDPSTSAAFVDVTSEDPDVTDTSFKDTTAGSLYFYLVTGVGPQGEGAKGHFGE